MFSVLDFRKWLNIFCRLDIKLIGNIRLLTVSMLSIISEGGRETGLTVHVSIVGVLWRKAKDKSEEDNTEMIEKGSIKLFAWHIVLSCKKCQKPNCIAAEHHHLYKCQLEGENVLLKEIKNPRKDLLAHLAWHFSSIKPFTRGET